MSRFLTSTISQLFVFLVLLAAGVAAEATSIKVIDKVSGVPLAGATIVGCNESWKTDQLGQASLTTCNELVVSYIGYLPQSIQATDSAVIVALIRTEFRMNDVLVTAHRTERSIDQTPRSAWSVDDRALETYGAQTAVEALRSVPGLSTADGGSFRVRPVMRGLLGSRLLLMVDGERLNDQREVSDFAGVSLSLLDANKIDQVEVVTGPGSSLYGSDAMGGVINVITRRQSFSDQLRPVVRYSARYSGSDEQINQHLTAGVTSQRWTAEADVSVRKTGRDFHPADGWQSSSQFSVFRSSFYDSLNQRTGRSFSGPGLVNTGAEAASYGLALGYRASRNARLNLKTGRSEASNVGYPGVPNDSTPFYFSYPYHERTYASLELTDDKSFGSIGQLKSKLYFQRVEKQFNTDFLGSLQIPTGPGGPTIVPQNADNFTDVSRYGFASQQQFSPADKLHLMIGFDGWLEQISGRVREVTLYDFAFPGPPDMLEIEDRANVPTSDWRAIGLFARSEHPLAGMTAEYVVRGDFVEVETQETPGYVDDSSRVLPTENSSYQSLSGSLSLTRPISLGVSAFASASTAYRIPNTIERFYYGEEAGRTIRPNPDISPERSYTAEAGFKGVQPELSYAIVGFYSWYDQFIQLRQNEDATWQYTNAEEATIFGFETMIEGALPIGLFASLALSWQQGDSKIDSLDQPLFVSPLSTTTTLGWRDRDRARFVEASVRWVDAQTRIAQTTALEDVPTPSFRVVNLSAGYRLWDRVQSTVTVRNLFDELYSEPHNARISDNPIPEPGRAVAVSFSTELF